MQNKHEINVTFISGRTHLPHAVTVEITDTIKNTMLSRQTSKGFEESILNQPTHPFMNFASVFPVIHIRESNMCMIAGYIRKLSGSHD